MADYVQFASASRCSLVLCQGKVRGSSVVRVHRGPSSGSIVWSIVRVNRQGPSWSIVVCRSWSITWLRQLIEGLDQPGSAWISLDQPGSRLGVPTNLKDVPNSED